MDKKDELKFRELNLVLEAYDRGFITDEEFQEIFKDIESTKTVPFRIKNLAIEASQHKIFDRTVPITENSNANQHSSVNRFNASPTNTGRRIEFSSNSSERQADRRLEVRGLSNRVPFTEEQDAAIADGILRFGTKWTEISRMPVFHNKDAQQIKARARTIAKRLSSIGESLGVFKDANY